MRLGSELLILPKNNFAFSYLHRFHRRRNGGGTSKDSENEENESDNESSGSVGSASSDGSRTRPQTKSTNGASAASNAGNKTSARKGAGLTASRKVDYWENTPSAWVRHHITPRASLFTPVGNNDGPFIEDIAQKRTTVFTFSGGNPQQETVKDEWNDLGPKAPRSLDQKWTGKTIFAKKVIKNKTKTSARNGAGKNPQRVMLEYCAGEIFTRTSYREQQEL